jgi:ankyrin repeat protein
LPSKEPPPELLKMQLEPAPTEELKFAWLPAGWDSHYPSSVPEPEPEPEPTPKKTREEWLSSWLSALWGAATPDTPLPEMESTLQELDAELQMIGKEALTLVLPVLAKALEQLQGAKIKALASAALFVAVEHGSVQAAAQLIRDGAAVSSRRIWGLAKVQCTPLFIAAAIGHSELVQLLLSAKADPCSIGRVEDGATALHAAVRNGEAETVRTLLVSVGDVERQKLLLAAPKAAVVLSCERTVPTLPEKQPAPVGTGGIFTPNCLVTQLPSFEELVTRSRQATQVGYRTSIGLAQLTELVDLWQAALAAPALTNGSKERRSVARTLSSLEEGKAEWTDELLERQVSLEHGCPMLLAAELGYANVVSELVVASADVDVVRKTDSLSALQVASVRGHAPTVRALLQAGANVSFRRKKSDGPMALHLAASLGHVAVVAELLRDGGVGVESTTHGSLTPILLAVDGGHGVVATMIQRFLSHKRHRTHRNRLPVEAWSRRIGPAPRPPAVPSVRTIADMWWPAHPEAYPMAGSVVDQD